MGIEQEFVDGGSPQLRVNGHWWQGQDCGLRFEPPREPWGFLRLRSKAAPTRWMLLLTRSCSQMRMTRQPAARRMLVVRLSRAMFPAIFADQYDRFDRGVVP